MALQQIVLHGQNHLWTYKARGYRCVDRCFRYLAFFPYLALQQATNKLCVAVPSANSRSVTCDVWSHTRLVDSVNNVNDWKGIKTAILYLHGGGVAAGNRCSAAPFSVTLLGRVSPDTVVVCVDYVLSTELEFTAPLEDCVACVEYFSHRVPSLILVGDSGGGNLVASTLLTLKESSLLHHVKGAIMLSPMLDNRHDKTYPSELVQLDVIQPRLANGTSVQLCSCSVRAATDPILSPILAVNLSGLPPLLIHAGDSEIFHDDCKVFATRAQNCGVDVTFRAFEGLPHCFQMLAPDLQETSDSLEEMAQFIKRVAQ